MAVDKNSTGFTLIFVVLMVVIVGAVLASLAFGLKPRQDGHADDKKRMDILAAIGVDSERSTVKEIFPQYITDFYMLDNTGKVLSTEQDEVFSVDVKKQHRNTQLIEADKKFPLYRAKNSKGEELLVVPMVGKGLWGPIWGYVAMNQDLQTIYGASFDHKTETPGLGAEIKTDFFEKQWASKKLNTQASAKMLFEVTKGAGSSSGEHQVDGITGGTITSKGVEEMVNRTMNIYRKYDSSKAQLN